MLSTFKIVASTNLKIKIAKIRLINSTATGLINGAIVTSCGPSTINSKDFDISRNPFTWLLSVQRNFSSTTGIFFNMRDITTITRTLQQLLLPLYYYEFSLIFVLSAINIKILSDSSIILQGGNL